MSLIPEETQHQVLKLLEQGKSYRAIQEATGLSLGSISNIACRAHLRRRVMVDKPTPALTAGPERDGLTEYLGDEPTPVQPVHGPEPVHMNTPVQPMNEAGPVHMNAPVQGAQPVHEPEPVHVNAPVQGVQSVHDPEPVHVNNPVQPTVQGVQPVHVNAPSAGSGPVQHRKVYGCAVCGARWRLAVGEHQVTSCPVCSVAFASRRIYGCAVCNARWRLQPGEAQVRRCPVCGVRLRDE